MRVVQLHYLSSSSSSTPAKEPLLDHKTNSFIVENVYRIRDNASRS